MNSVETEHTNIGLIYEYTKSCLDGVNNSINSLNTKLSSVIGFSGVVLKFAGEIEGDEWSIMAKVAICILLSASIWSSLLGLKPKNVGDKVDPRELRQDFYYQPDEECRRYIVDNWNRAIEQLDKNRDEKQWYLNIAIVLFALASTLFAVNIILSSLP